jgi:hypothetical protein
MEMNNNQSEPPIENTPRVSKFNVEEPKTGFSMKKLLPVGIGVFSALVVFLVVWFVFLHKPLPGFLQRSASGQNGQSQANANDKVVNPITGSEMSQQQAEDWKDVRPVAVMINNYVDARPQSGLNQADFVYEMVAEGGITRFIAFYLNNSPEKVGPVRSTRDYYLVLVKEMGDAMVMHIGWSPQALEAIQTWPVRSLARGGASLGTEYAWRDQKRINEGYALEHTAYTNVAKLRELGDQLGWGGKRDFKVWAFNEDPNKYADYPEAHNISIDFWYKGDYSAIFKYDPEQNDYLRFTGYDENGDPIPHVDAETGEQFRAKNVIVQFAVETPIPGDAKNRLEYELVGSGSAIVFVDGHAVEATWTKEGRDDRTMFYDTNGNEIQFNRGKFWISIVPARNVDQVVYN